MIWVDPQIRGAPEGSLVLGDLTLLLVQKHFVRLLFFNEISHEGEGCLQNVLALTLWELKNASYDVIKKFLGLSLIIKSDFRVCASL